MAGAGKSREHTKTPGRLATAGATVTLALAAAACAPRLPEPNSHGITLKAWTEVDTSVPASLPRLLDATMETAAIYEPGAAPTIDPVTVPVKVRILLPANYHADGDPYPVLYLLHGGGEGYTSWSTGADIVDIVSASAFDGIVVMPEGGRSGWYSDWAGEADGQFKPQWETFHIAQLVPWIDANFNTVGDRSGRAVAGLSMGGLGALMYAGRHTDVFSAVGSFSGGTDITEPGAWGIVSGSMWWFGAQVGGSGGRAPADYWVSGDAAHQMETVFGPQSTWSERNPLSLAAEYHAYATKFGLYSGRNDPAVDGEGNIGMWNDEFHAALVGQGVDHRYCAGLGTHSWGFWQEDLADFLAYVYGTTPATCPNGWGNPE
jgi:S-formylglutathione hydrolase FrmB